MTAKMAAEDLPRNKGLKIMAGATVCNESELLGDITIGTMTIIHPKATIIAEAGPIIIGEGNLIEEQSKIINKLQEGSKPSESNILIIGNYNVFEVDCHSEAMKIGDNNVLEAKSFVGRDVELTNGCVIGSGCRMTSPEVIPDNLVVFGSSYCRRKQLDKPPAQTLQIDYLTRTMPGYHHLKRPNMKK